MLHQHRCVWSDQLIRTIRKAQDERRRRAGATSSIARACVDARRYPINGHQDGPQGKGAFPFQATVTCDYSPKDLAGGSPKFACVAGDDELKVKFGGG